MQSIDVRSRHLPVLIAAIFLLIGITHGYAENQTDKVFVGSQACQECHDVEYENFTTHAKKATSFESVQVMAKGLTDAEQKECFTCHTTGYGAPGGFVSATETPHLKDAGCEVCHGPGSAHIETEDPEDINYDVTIEVCNTCHNPDRIASFKYKPLLFGGAH
jgi:hypothetical protein